MRIKLEQIEIFLITFSLLYFCFMIFAVFTVVKENKLKCLGKNQKNKSFHKSTGEFLENLIEEDEILFKNEGQNIFFIDGVPLEENAFNNARRACAVESAALLNPNLSIYLIFTSFTGQMILEKTNLSTVLSSYGNIKFNFINLNNYCNGTILNSWMMREPYWTYSNDEVAEVLRMLLLHKYGGYSIDLGVLTLKSFDDIEHENFACAKYRFKILSSIVRLSSITKNPLGHKIAEEFLKSVSKTFENLPKAEEIDEILLNPNHEYFQSNESNVQSPQIIFQDIIKKQCRNQIFDYHKLNECDGFSILPLSECPPAFPKNWLKMFDEKEARKVLLKIKESHFLNMWSDQSFSGLEEDYLKINSKAALVQIFKEKCPKVFSTLSEEF